MMAAVLGFTACSKEEIAQNETSQKGMVLRATVEQSAETRATYTCIGKAWQFAFAAEDKISVTNTAVGAYYTFTNDGTEFTSKDARSTASDETWYAYFPSNEISLVGQSGAQADVANKYALAGATAEATSGEDGLNITMVPQAAILVIKNYLGCQIDLNVKNSASTWVSGLTANEDGFDITTETSRQDLLNVTTPGIYYIAVPAGVQLAIKNGDEMVKSTGTDGLAAGRYYKLSFKSDSVPTGSRGKAYSAESASNVDWLQLWENGPKYAAHNMGATSPTGFGDYYNWGGITPNGDGIKWEQDNASAADGVLEGEFDTATYLWGSKWRMPAPEELEALVGVDLGAFVTGDKCIAEWIDGETETYENTSVVGLLCTGVYEYSSNSVFLPAAGYCIKEVNDKGNSSIGSVQHTNYTGYYWSNTPNGVRYAKYLFIRWDGLSMYDNFLFRGCSVRPLLAE